MSYQQTCSFKRLREREREAKRQWGDDKRQGGRERWDKPNRDRGRVLERERERRVKRERGGWRERETETQRHRERQTERKRGYRSLSPFWNLSRPWHNKLIARWVTENKPCCTSYCTSAILVLMHVVSCSCLRKTQNYDSTFSSILIQVYILICAYINSKMEGETGKEDFHQSECHKYIKSGYHLFFLKSFLQTCMPVNKG